MSPYSAQFLAGDASHERAPLARPDWVAQCVQHLRALRPHDDPLLLAHVADQAWVDVSGFDPRVAAEMEHLSWV